MKKILSFIAIFLMATAIVACTEVENTIKITQTPATSYLVGYEGIVEFGLELDDVPHLVKWENNKYTVKVAEAAPVEVSAIPDFSITPLDFSSPGTKTVVFQYKSLSARFEYQVVADELPTGTGTQNDPFLVYSAEDLTNTTARGILGDKNRTNTVYFKLANDIDFATHKLYIDVYNISIDGAKALGGNYKISNIQGQSLFKDGFNVTLKNIDIVNASTDMTIIGVVFSSFHFDNVNILGDSAASSAAYVHTANTSATDVSTIKNSTTHANLVRFDAGSSTGAFVRYVSYGSLEIENSFNHGHIQALNSMSGGLVGTANTGTVSIKNSGNMGKVTLYVGSQSDYNTMVANLANAEYDGIYSIIGHNMGSNGMNSFYPANAEAKNRVILNNNQFDKANVEIVKVNDFSFGAAINFSEAAFLSGYTVADLKSVQVTVTNGSAKSHILNSGTLTAHPSNSGNVVVYRETFTSFTNFNLVTSETVKTIVSNPYTTHITAQATLNGVNVQNVVVNAGYDIFADGLYRVATTSSSNHLISVIGHNAAGEVIFVSVAVLKF